MRISTVGFLPLQGSPEIDKDPVIVDKAILPLGAKNMFASFSDDKHSVGFSSA